MRSTLLTGALAGAITLGLSACSQPASDTVATAEAPAAEAKAASAPAADANPFFTASTLPLQTPDFSKIRVEHFQPAIEEGMRQHLVEIEAIATNSEPPTVDNTLVAMERSGALLTRAAKTFGNLAGTDSTDEIRSIQAAISPKLAAHQDAILLNAQLFDRVKKLYETRESLGLDPETLRLVEQTHLRFVRAGAELDETAKAQIRKLNEEQASLMTAFGQALLKQTEQSSVLVEDVAELDGLSEGMKAAAAEAAKAAGHEGKWLLRLTNTTRQPVLTSLNNRDLRQRVWEASARRGLNEGAGDTRPMILRLAALRAERAALLGAPNHAVFQLENQTAGTPERVMTMMTGMAPDVVKKAQAEAAEIQAAINASGADFELAPWDWEYYAEKVRAQKYDLDPEQVKPYFELDRVLVDGVFHTMNRFFGISFRERSDLPVYHPDVRVFDVLDADGSQIGLFYGDYFARPGKRGGAWMTTFVDQSHLLEQKPVVVNVMNIPKPAAGQPALMTFDEVTTMFHEMGHGVHGLFSNVRYPSLTGTAVPRDFVEFPSQFEEDWAKHPEILANYAKHHETGEPIPAELMQKIQAAGGFNQGFETLEYLGAALLDMEWHLLPTGQTVEDVETFEQAALKKHGVDYAPVPPRYRSGYFAHVFSGGYSAGYYAYLWSEVLAADAFAHVTEQGGLKPELGAAFREAVLSRGGSQDPLQMYVAWRGGEPDTDNLLIRRGLKGPGGTLTQSP
jgi:peptidyl-dipeptidase Dcp